jgi:hypothetical protein
MLKNLIRMLIITYEMMICYPIKVGAKSSIKEQRQSHINYFNQTQTLIPAGNLIEGECHNIDKMRYKPKLKVRSEQIKKIS